MLIKLLVKFGSLLSRYPKPTKLAMNSLMGIVILLAVVQADPPDMVSYALDIAYPVQVQPLHIIKTRSIDLNNAHNLAIETRLVKSVTPTAYALKMAPDLDKGIFEGSLMINVTWLESTDEINLHCSPDLNVTLTHLKIFTGEHDSKDMAIKKTSIDPKKSIYTIKMQDPVPAKINGQLLMTFNGTMNTANTEGFFKINYTGADALDNIVVVATNLRPNYARRMFPCFDEPGYKATFDLTVIRPSDKLTLASSALIQSKAQGVNFVDIFDRTPPLPTYGVGIVMGNISPLGESRYKDEAGNDIKISVWGRQSFSSALNSFLKKVVVTFKELAEFFKVKLPLARMDIIALPNYTGVKPADHWGLIIFKESDVTSKGYLPIAQELSYQWLGLLTSPVWWNDAHINKALVGYLAAEIAFKINNGSEMEGKWPMTVLYSLYYEYSKRYPHSKITGMKQETACTKMELLFRMFNYTLGGNTFKKGIRRFLEANTFKTFTGNDIWDSLTKAAHEDGKLPKEMDVKTIALSWIMKDRLPLVSARRKYEDKSVHITQRLYLRERPHDVLDVDKLTWWTPLVIVRSDRLCFTNTTPTIWIRNHNEITNIFNMPTKDNFIIINPEEIAPFPVNYDEENWNLILNFLQTDKRTQIPEMTRAKLLHDAWNLAYAGELSFATALNMTLFLKHEKHHLVWDPVFTMIDHIGSHICECIQEKFHAFVRMLLSPLYEELKRDEKIDEIIDETKDKDSWRKNLKSLTKTFLCKVGYQPCLQEAQEHFRTWMDADNPDEGNPISNQYICPVFKWGTLDEWEFGLRRVINFPATRKLSERTYLLKTLAGCPMDTTKIQRLLSVTILESNGNFTDTDLFLVFSMLTGNPQGYTTLYDFLDINWTFLKDKFAKKTNLWDALVNSATSQFTTNEGLNLVIKMRQDHLGNFGSAEHIIEKNIRTIKEEASWSNRNVPVIEKWLDSFLEQNSAKLNGSELEV